MHSQLKTDYEIAFSAGRSMTNFLIDIQTSKSYILEKNDTF